VVVASMHAMMPCAPADSGTQETPRGADLQSMVTTLARAGAIALALLLLPASSPAEGLGPEMQTGQWQVSVPAYFPAGFYAHPAHPEADAVTVSWAFDDGATASGETVSHAWTTPGSHLAGMTATGANGATTSSLFTIQVDPNPSGFQPLPTPPPGFVFPDLNARPAAALADRSLKLSANRSVAVRITCRTRSCKGTVALTLAGKKLGTASFSSRPDQTTTVHVRVSRLTAARLRRHRSLRVGVTVAVRGADPASVTRTVTLRTR
jgi:PKD repeat protein